MYAWDIHEYPGKGITPAMKKSGRMERINDCGSDSPIGNGQCQEAGISESDERLLVSG